MMKLKNSLQELNGILRFRNKICVLEDDELKQMSYLRVMKASSITSKYNPTMSRFQEIYLVTWYKKEDIVKFVVARLSVKNSKGRTINE